MYTFATRSKNTASPSIYVWADGTWCWDYEMEDMSHGKPGGCRRIEVTDDCDDEDAERIADMEGDHLALDQLEPELGNYPDPPYAIAIGSFLVSLTAAWLVVHLTGYVWWFVVGYITYTLVGFFCWWACARNAREQLIDTQPEERP